MGPPEGPQRSGDVTRRGPEARPRFGMARVRSGGPIEQRRSKIVSDAPPDSAPKTTAYLLRLRFADATIPSSPFCGEEARIRPAQHLFRRTGADVVGETDAHRDGHARIDAVPAIVGHGAADLFAHQQGPGFARLR